LTQEEIAAMMKRNPRRWFTSKEISLLINSADKLVRDDLALLTRFRIIVKEFQNRQNRWKWNDND
jgi:hypothetical protein